MNVVTYCNIWLKCYINLFNWFGIVADGKRSSNVLANAIDKYTYFVLKNIKNKVYCFFETGVNCITAESSLMSTSQVSWSPCSMFNNFTNPIGTTVLKLPALYDTLLLNVTFIPPFLLFFTYIFSDYNINNLCLFVMFLLKNTLQTFI